MDKVLLKVTKDYPIPSGRRYDIMYEGEKYGEFFCSNGRWNAVLPQHMDKPFNKMTNYTVFMYSNYFAMVRVIACYVLGEVDRIPHLLRGVWTNPCPTAEVAK